MDARAAGARLSRVSTLARAAGLVLCLCASAPLRAAPRADELGTWLERAAGPDADERERAQRWLATNLAARDLERVAAAVESGDTELELRLVHAIGSQARLLDLAVALALRAEPRAAELGREALREAILEWDARADEPFAPASDWYAELERRLDERLSVEAETWARGPEALFELLAHAQGGTPPLVCDPRLARGVSAAPARAHEGQLADLLLATAAEHELLALAAGFDAGEPRGRVWICLVPRGAKGGLAPLELVAGWITAVGDAARADAERRASARALAACGWPAALALLERRWLAGDDASFEGVLLAAGRGARRAGRASAPARSTASCARSLRSSTLHGLGVGERLAALHPRRATSARRRIAPARSRAPRCGGSVRARRHAAGTAGARGLRRRRRARALAAAVRARGVRRERARRALRDRRRAGAARRARAAGHRGAARARGARDGRAAPAARRRRGRAGRLGRHARAAGRARASLGAPARAVLARGLGRARPARVDAGRGARGVLLELAWRAGARGGAHGRALLAERRARGARGAAHGPVGARARRAPSAARALVDALVPRRATSARERLCAATLLAGLAPREGEARALEGWLAAGPTNGLQALALATQAAGAHGAEVRARLLELLGAKLPVDERVEPLLAAARTLAAAGAGAELEAFVAAGRERTRTLRDLELRARLRPDRWPPPALAPVRALESGERELEHW